MNSERNFIQYQRKREEIRRGTKQLENPFPDCFKTYPIEKIKPLVFQNNDVHRRFDTTVT